MATAEDRRRLLQSVTRLIEKPDLQALDMSLVATLREIITTRSIKLCLLHDNPDVPNRKLLICPKSEGLPSEAEARDAVDLEAEPIFLQCFQTGKKVIVSDGGEVRIIHPITSKSGIGGFLVLTCDKEDAHDQEIVSILLAFYKNYASLLYDSQRDELTGLLNRRTFDERVLQLVAVMRSSPPPVDVIGRCCLAVFDIDNFTYVNDQFGHLVGDETLVLFGRDMVDAFRGSDMLFRTGGEEFVVVLRDVDLARALTVLQRFRHTVENREYPQIGKMTISVGVSEITGNDFPTNVLDRANKALYYAKANGRNQIWAYEDLVADGKLEVIHRPTDAELF
jgi:diguanylate cyclase (GGDEF)-like protein